MANCLSQRAIRINKRLDIFFGSISTFFNLAEKVQRDLKGRLQYYVENIFANMLFLLHNALLFYSNIVNLQIQCNFTILKILKKAKIIETAEISFLRYRVSNYLGQGETRTFLLHTEGQFQSEIKYQILKETAFQLSLSSA